MRRCISVVRVLSQGSGAGRASAPVPLARRVDEKNDRDRGAGGGAVQADLVGDLVDDPQTVGVLGLPGGGGLAGGVLVCWSVVADLAVQRLAVCPQAEPSVAGAVAYRVGRQLVRGGDDVVDPLAGQAGLGGMRSDRRPQRVQRVAVEGLFQDRGAGPCSVSPGPESVLTG